MPKLVMESNKSSCKNCGRGAFVGSRHRLFHRTFRDNLWRLQCNESVAEAFLAVASTALVNVPEAEDDTFIVDSGASHHMVKNKHLVRYIVPSPIKAVEIGDGTRLPVIGEGNLTIDCLVFYHVLVVPTLSTNLLSTKCIPDHIAARLIVQSVHPTTGLASTVD